MAPNKAIVCVVLAAVCFSTAGVFVNIIGLDLWAVLFWRSAIAGSVFFISFIIGLTYGQDRRLSATVRDDLILAILLSIAMVSFVASLRLTSTAHVAIIHATLPLANAALSAWLYQIRVSRADWLACFAVAAGVAIMTSGSQEAFVLLGDALALVMTTALALFTIGLSQGRRSRSRILTLSCLITAVCSFPLAETLRLEASGIVLLVSFALIQMVFGMWLFVAGSRSLTPHTTALISCLEAPLAPILVWICIGIIPDGASFVGGTIILIATMNFLVKQRRATVSPINDQSQETS